MADFGQNRLWPKPTLAKTDFGQNRLWPKPTLTCCVGCVVCGVWCVVCGVFICVCVFVCLCVVCVFVWVCVLCGGCWFHGFRCGVSRVGVSFKVLVWSCSVPPGPPFPRTALPPDRPSPGPPKISLFFSLSRLKIRSFLCSLGVFSWNFGGVFEGREAQMCTFGPSGCRVKPRRARGFTLQLANI